eukprot:CAMPEP_0118880678 /NCGR_PEP_ID=MMETSP1163-20130328/20228_1 /TAXON_ID=124430 /ORGANISM="Phaeomonas parva, Strain CCMP2877" /LENGTH=36 /DNA_ID= /DNA_START= /DNA_END= /DNA_ORIENTATION=
MPYMPRCSPLPTPCTAPNHGDVLGGAQAHAAGPGMA